MDGYDRKILQELRRNGRITNQELSERINLSPSPCLRRVRAMEESGVIAGYTTIIDQSKLGKSVTLFVRVKLERHNRTGVAEFERGVQNSENVLACYLISGEYDYLLHIIMDNLESYEEFVRTELHNLAGVSGIDSGFAYGCIKQPTGVYVSGDLQPRTMRKAP